LDDPLYAGFLAGGEEGLRRFCVDRRDRLAGAALEDAGAVDDRLDAGEARLPILGPDVAIEVGGEGAGRRQEAIGLGGAADRGNDAMPRSYETCQQISADEAVCAGQENVHATPRWD